MSSMDLAEKRGQTLKRLLALLHLLREERRIDSDLADELLNKTEKEVMSAKSKEFIAMFDAIKLEKREDLERT